MRSPKPSLRALVASVRAGSGARGPELRPGLVPYRVYSHAEMLQHGAGGHLRRATLTRIPLSKIEGRDPIPEPDSYRPGRAVTEPIEVVWDPGQGAYMLYAGNHRVRQAEVNGDRDIWAFVERGG